MLIQISNNVLLLHDMVLYQYTRVRFRLYSPLQMSNNLLFMHISLFHIYIEFKLMIILHD